MTKIREVLAGEKIGYRVMRYVDGKAVSGADSRQAFELKKGGVIRLTGKGMFLSLDRQYVLDHYAGHDVNVLLTCAFDPKHVTSGNLTDRQTEFTVSEAVLKDFEVIPGED